MRTRERIIEEARLLFNEQGYGAVTTAALAAHCGIAEGNLWYHFKTRSALLDAIGERYAAAVDARLELTPRDDPLAGYVRLLAALMAEFREFRFLYRDQQSYGEHADTIRARAPDWLVRSFLQFEAHLAALVDAGLLDWPRDRLRELATNATIILRYGLEHSRELGAPTGTGSGAVRRTLAQHLTLFEHQLTEDAARTLRQAVAAIGDEALAAPEAAG